MPAVSTEKLTKIYGQPNAAVTALDHVSLQLDAGEFVAVMGPSGCGKSTLLHLIGGLDRPTEGRVLLNGSDLSALDDKAISAVRRRNIGFVFQFYNLLPVLSAQRNVELPLLLTNLSASQRRRNAEVALELVGLKDRANHKPKELSGGQEQRVAIARAIVSDPTILVCDEPTGDLDRKTADEILGLLRTLNREHGKTIVVVTHDPKAADFATHILHLEKGTLVERAIA